MGGDSSRVLVVDDNEDAAFMLGELLLHHGWTVLTAHTPSEALDLVPSFAPHVVILDIGMPEMSGWELAQRILATGLKCRLIAVTGYGTEDDRERSRAAGLSAHLMKPASIEAILSAIEE